MPRLAVETGFSDFDAAHRVDAIQWVRQAPPVGIIYERLEQRALLSLRVGAQFAVGGMAMPTMSIISSARRSRSCLVMPSNRA